MEKSTLQSHQDKVVHILSALNERECGVEYFMATGQMEGKRDR